MPSLRSFARYYWGTWLVALALYALGAFLYSPRAALGWFALFAGVASVYIFHFEFGRLMGFLRVHCPTQYAELQRQPLLELLAFVHPGLIAKSWQPGASPARPQEGAFSVYRSAWLFSLVSLVVLTVLANVAQ